MSERVVPLFVLKMVEHGSSWACHIEEDGGWTITVKKVGAANPCEPCRPFGPPEYGHRGVAEHSTPYAFWLGADA